MSNYKNVLISAVVALVVALGVVSFFPHGGGNSTVAKGTTQTGLPTAAPANTSAFVGPYGVESDAGYYDTPTASSTFEGALTSSGLFAASGITLVNNLVNAYLGYSQSFSTAVNTAFTVTPQQFCNGTSILIPLGNTTTVTVTLPNASTTFLACGAVAGGYSQQLITNLSSFAVTFATSTGGGALGSSLSQFFMATGTPAASITYPPKIQASTTATFLGTYTSTSSNQYLIDQFSRAAGY